MINELFKMSKEENIQLCMAKNMVMEEDWLSSGCYAIGMKHLHPAIIKAWHNNSLAMKWMLLKDLYQLDIAFKLQDVQGAREFDLLIQTAQTLPYLSSIILFSPPVDVTEEKEEVHLLSSHILYKNDNNTQSCGYCRDVSAFSEQALHLYDGER